MNVLAIRFSSIGDVVLTLPAIVSALQNNPSLEIYFVSKPFFKPIFQGIDRLHFIGKNPRDYKGIQGLWKLKKELKAEVKGIQVVLDLHDSLRTRILKWFWYAERIPIHTIHKGRNEKRWLVRPKNKKIKPLKHHVDRYADVFLKANLSCQPSELSVPIIHIPDAIQESITSQYPKNPDEFRLGIAPFTSSSLKEWPLRKWSHLILQLFQQQPNLQIYIFGGPENIPELEPLISLQKNKIKSAIGFPNGLEGEMALMQTLDLMISMDSGNLHIASLLGVPIKAIFGPTHPYLGFAPYLQEKNVIQMEDLSCRPCSVYGNVKCKRGDHACLEKLEINPKGILPIDS